MRREPHPSPRELEEARRTLEGARSRCLELYERAREAQPGTALEELESPAWLFAETLREALEFVDSGKLAAALCIVGDRLFTLIDLMEHTSRDMVRVGGYRAKKAAGGVGRVRKGPSQDDLETKVRPLAEELHRTGNVTWEAALRRALEAAGMQGVSPSSARRRLPLHGPKVAH
jgi:hypothetical protein